MAAAGRSAARSSIGIWGPFLAKNGVAVFAFRYRLSKPGAKSYPGAVYDVKAAVQFVRANAAQLGVDPDRIGMVGIPPAPIWCRWWRFAGDEPLFSSRIPQRTRTRRRPPM